MMQRTLNALEGWRRAECFCVFREKRVGYAWSLIKNKIRIRIKTRKTRMSFNPKCLCGYSPRLIAEVSEAINLVFSGNSVQP